MELDGDIRLETNPPVLSEAGSLGEMFASKKQYEKQLRAWQKRLLHVQQVCFHQGQRAIIVMEGWDAAGKGGSIRRLTEKLDPRGFDVFPIGAPKFDEKKRHYLARFQKRLPHAGKIAIFDRSWYGRVLVERVEGFASDEEWQRAYREINEWERMLLDDDYRIIKMFLHITPEEQLNRFAERLKNPVKQWKLTAEDIRNRERWGDYEQSINNMFARTSTTRAPWHIIPGNRKWFTRVKVLQTVVEALERDMDLKLPDPDPEMVRAAYEKLGLTLDAD